MDKDVMQQMVAEIRSLRKEIGGRFDLLEKKLSKTTACAKSTRRVVEVQKEQIDALKRRIDCLEAIWTSSEDRRYALDKNEVYAEAKKCGLSAKQALAVLDQENLLYKDSDQRRTACVKVDGRPTRAVVLFWGE